MAAKAEPYTGKHELLAAIDAPHFMCGIVLKGKSWSVAVVASVEI
jgi:hypothetical protein